MICKKPLLANRKQCTGCMACIDACGHGALKTYTASDGHLYVGYDSKKCTGCGCCSTICPVVCGYRYETPDDRSTVYAAWAVDEALRGKSSSGGVFAALARQVILQGGYAVGAVMEETHVRHRLIGDLRDIVLLQGSKYQQGDLTGIYRQVRSTLRAGRPVLFSGTGCQVGALLAFLGENRYPELLTTVDMICGGFPSILPLRLYMKNAPVPVRRIVSFRDKDRGWKSRGYRYTFKTEDINGTIWDEGDTNVVSAVFSSHLASRFSCFDCRFAFARRKSDLTIGDFWGDTDYPRQHERGLSVVVAHNDRGRTFLSGAGIELRETDWGKFVRNNFRMVCGRYNLPCISACGRYVAIRMLRLACRYNMDTTRFMRLYNLYARLFLGVEGRMTRNYRNRKCRNIGKNER